MKNLLKQIGVVVLTAVIVFTIAACGDSAGGSIDVERTQAENRLSFVSGDYQLSIENSASKAAYAPQSGDSYKLIKISSSTVVSSGTVMISGSNYTFNDSDGTTTFTATVTTTTITLSTNSIKGQTVPISLTWGIIGKWKWTGKITVNYSGDNYTVTDAELDVGTNYWELLSTAPVSGWGYWGTYYVQGDTFVDTDGDGYAVLSGPNTLKLVINKNTDIPAGTYNFTRK